MPKSRTLRCRAGAPVWSVQREGTGDAEAVDLAIQDRVPEVVAVESPSVRRGAIVTEGGAVPCKMLMVVVPSTAVRHSPVSEPAVERKTRSGMRETVGMR